MLCDSLWDACGRNYHGVCMNAVRSTSVKVANFERRRSSAKGDEGGRALGITSLAPRVAT